MDLSKDVGQNKASLDSERSIWERIEQEIKSITFGVLFNLLKDDEPSIYISILVTVIQFIQILYFPFHKYLKSAWKYSDVANPIESVLSYFHLVTYFEMTNFNGYIIMFYVCLVITILTILDVFYVSYNVSRKKNAFSWPLYVLRTMLTLFQTILFIPFFEYFCSVLSCQTNSNNTYVSTLFDDVKCWSGIHIMHGIIAVLIAITFAITCLFSALTYYECRNTQNDPTARSNSKPTIIFLLYQIVIIICFTFMHSEDLQYVHIAFQLVGTLIVFCKFHYDSPYYNETLQKLWSFLTAILVWTSILLAFAKFLENNLFEGTIFAWMVGVPLIILIVINSKRINIDALLMNVNKFESGSQLLIQIRELQKLMNQKNSSKIASILIDGYLEVHRNTCNNDECATKVALKQKKMAKGKNDNDAIQDQERIQVMQNLLLQMFFLGIKKFPVHTELRLQYAFFLLDNKKYNRQQALSELTQAEQNNPSFDQDFIIFRYKKIIEDEIAESQNDGGNVDIVSEMAFQNSLKLMQNYIERSAHMHMEFWSQLSEDNPDLGKLNEIGIKINQSVSMVDEIWNKVKKMSSNLPKASRLYGKYLIEVINDKDAGEDLLKRAKNIQSANTHNHKIQIFTSNEDIAQESYPTIIITTEQDKFGHIIALNLSACNLFGYQKSEVINRKINMLMPSLHSKYHDSFLENLKETQQPSFMTKERMIYGKNKSGYIFPCYISIQSMQSLNQGYQYVSTFRVEKNFRKVCFIYTDKEGSIEHISSSCINFLKIDNKYISTNKVNINDLFKNILEEKATYMTKQGATIQYNPPNDIEVQGEEAIDFNLTISEISFTQVKEAGYVFKFEKTVPQGTEGNLNSSLVGAKKAKPQLSTFQFAIDPKELQILGRYMDQPCSELQSQRFDETAIIGFGALEPEQSSQNDTNQEELIKSNLQTGKADNKHDGDENVPEKKNYGEGIKIQRLQHDGKLGEIDDDQQDEEEEDEEKSKSLFVRNQDEDDGEDFSVSDISSIFKNKQALSAIVNDTNESKEIINLKRVVNILILILIVVGIVDYALTIKQYKNLKSNVNLIILSNKRIAELESILANVRDLKFLNYGLFNNTYYVNTTQDEMASDFADDISTDTVSVQDLQKQLTFSEMDLLPEHKALLSEQIITIYFSDQSTSKSDLNDATQMMINYAFAVSNAVSNSKLSSLTETDSNVYFVENNMFQDYYSALLNSSFYYIESFSKKTTDKKLFTAIIAVSAVMLFITLIIVVPMLMVANRSRQNVLELFLDIPEKSVKSLYQRCENFISNLQIGEDEEQDEEEQPQHEQEDIEGSFRMRRKRKRYKNSAMSQKKFVISMLICILVIEAYFIFNYFMSDNLLSDMKSLIKEINSTSLAEPFYMFVDNALRQLLFNQTFEVLGQDPSTVTANNIQELFVLDSDIHQSHSLNINIHSKVYKDAFNTIMMLDPCEIIYEMKGSDISTCQSFAEGSVYQGMAVAITRYFENLRYIQTLYTKFLTSIPTSATFSSVAPTSTPYMSNITYPAAVGNNLEIALMSLIVSSNSIEVRTMGDIYIKNSFRYLMIKFQDSIKSTIDSGMTQRLILFVVFIVIFFIVYFIFWLPLVSRLTKSINRTRGMLTMIPLSVISYIKSIRIYIRKYITQQRNHAN